MWNADCGGTELIEVINEGLWRGVDVLVPDGAVGECDVHCAFGPDAAGAVDVGDVGVFGLQALEHER